MASGVLGIVAGSLAAMGVYPLPGEAALAITVFSLVLGGVFLGSGLRLWSRARKEKKRRVREWQHALEMLRLREQQAEDDPALTVEVLDRVDVRHPSLISERYRRASIAAKYAQ